MANRLRLDSRYLKGFVSDRDLEGISDKVREAHMLLVRRGGPGKDFLGWMNLPEDVDESLLKDMEEIASGLNGRSDAIVIIGIGGSYLGARAVIETLSPGLIGKRIFFTGYDLSGDNLSTLLEALKDKDVGVNVVSKSGTTTEPAITFRIIEDFLKVKYGPGNIADRIICTTDGERGALKAIADREGYRRFVIPADVGGRFSVLTPVGLLPVACAGINIRDLVAGARDQREHSLSCDFKNNISYKYAAIRNLLYGAGKRIEILSNFDNRLHYVGEWWKQLFGESEGKDGHSIFPASCDFPADLHSMGQLIQEGERNLFETFLVVEKESGECPIPWSNEDLDNLNYLADRQVDYVKKRIYEAAAEAHFEGGVPSSTVYLPEKSAFCLGQLLYFFEKAAAISAYMFGVNPFNQPGVDSYKRKMFKLLGKPGT